MNTSSSGTNRSRRGSSANARLSQAGSAHSYGTNLPRNNGSHASVNTAPYSALGNNYSSSSSHSARTSRTNSVDTSNSHSNRSGARGSTSSYGNQGFRDYFQEAPEVSSSGGENCAYSGASRRSNRSSSNSAPAVSRRSASENEPSDNEIHLWAQSRISESSGDSDAHYPSNYGSSPSHSSGSCNTSPSSNPRSRSGATSNFSHQ